MEYKRIARTKYHYALYPKDLNIDDLIRRSGSEVDYYESIYNYKQEHYTKFINGLKEACNYTGVNFDESNLLDTSKLIFFECGFQLCGYASRATRLNWEVFRVLRTTLGVE